MPTTKLLKRQTPFTPRFLPSPFFAPIDEFGDLTLRTQQLVDDMF